jgi:uncharacterized membrane protein YfcA
MQAAPRVLDIFISAGIYRHFVDALTFSLMSLLIFGVSFIYSNLGLGGGLLYVPILLSIATPDKLVAVPISLTFTTATGLASFINHHRRRLADVRLGSILVIGALAGTVIGVFFNIGSTKEQFVIFFVAVLCIFGVQMIHNLYRRPHSVDSDNDVKMTRGRLGTATTGEIGAGFLSGALGIGGGLVNVPIMVGVLGRATRKAIGTSSFIIIPTSLLSFLTYAVLEPADYSVFWLIPVLAPLVFVGAYIGSRWGLAKLKTKTVTLIFILMLFVAAAKLIWDILPH